ncbi:MAG: class I SAM-dependent methyltransferase [Anaerolineae bacterium]|nr:class I SAM-dependent methyltransferase [Anaerolineae bacterium]
MHTVDLMNTCRMGQYYDRTEKAIFRPYLPDNPARVLDLGGGTGRWSSWMAGMGHQVLLLDRDMSVLKIARQRLPNITSAHSNVETIPAPDETFDVVFAVQMIGMIKDRPHFFREIHRVLKPDGLLFITWDNKNSIKGLLYKTYARVKGISQKEQEFFYQFSHTDYAEALQNAGFFIREARGYAWTLLPRSHDTVLVNAFVALEQGLRLHKRLSISPNVITVAQKR